ncbi:Hypothetical protein GLP15_1889 [Giardia lamblia P15]|uniref:Uncharacterized protein n=1 Tax=Giardia intestinalis (strain P15) TaxID=658858 RepID=E1F5Z0_GIAIA|nr:Hypothetical protein GLP15_1889 [Giardia lamblia P15]
MPCAYICESSMVEGSVCTNSRGLSHGLQLCPLQGLQAFLDVACPSPVDCCAESAVALRLLRFLLKRARCRSTSSPTLVESAIGRTQSTELLPLSPQDIHKEWCQLIYIGTCELAPSAHAFCTVYETDGPCGASSRLWTGDACSSAWRACRWIPAVVLGPGGEAEEAQGVGQRRIEHPLSLSKARKDARSHPLGGQVRRCPGTRGSPTERARCCAPLRRHAGCLGAMSS